MDVWVECRAVFKLTHDPVDIPLDNCPRWQAHKHFFALRFSVSFSEMGKQGQITAMVEGKEGNIIEAKLHIDDVLAEPVIEVPETLEFRPAIATGRPMRRNNLVLYVNPLVVSPGHYVRVQITKRTGNVLLIGPSGARCEQVDVKLDADQHQVMRQNVLRVLIPWSPLLGGERVHPLSPRRRRPDASRCRQQAVGQV